MKRDNRKIKHKLETQVMKRKYSVKHKQNSIFIIININFFFFIRVKLYKSLLNEINLCQHINNTTAL